VQLLAVAIRENHGAAGDLMPALQDVEDRMQRGLRLRTPESAWLTSSSVARRRVSFVWSFA
jgi:hypothetical protein